MRVGALRERCILRSKVDIMLLLIVSASVIATGCGRSDSSPVSVAAGAATACLRPTCEEVPVKRGDVTVSVSADGALQFVNKADLFFRAEGRVSSVDVRVGDIVEKGQVLATLDRASLELAVATAKVSLGEAEEALDELLEPVTSEELLDAELAVAVAQNALRVAEEEFNLAQEGPTEQELAQSVADVSATQVALQEAEEALKLLIEGPTTEEFAEAMESVAEEKSSLLKAEQNLADLKSRVSSTVGVEEAESNLALAGADLEEAQATSAELEAGPDPSVVSESQQLLELAQIDVLTSELELARLEEKTEVLVLPAEWDLAEARLARALLDVEEAEEALEEVLAGATELELTRARLEVVAAEVAVAKAEQTLEVAKVGPTEEELAAIEDLIKAINLGLEAAHQKLAELSAIPDPLKIKEQEDQVALALANMKEAEENLGKLSSGADPELVREKHANLTTVGDALVDAEEALALLRDGSDPSDVELKRKEVGFAQAAIVRAQDDLDNWTIDAPFDGIVSAVNVEYGQDVEPNYGPRTESEDALIELLDTRVLEIVALVDETDVSLVKIGQDVNITINALPDTAIHGTVVNVSTVAADEAQGKDAASQPNDAAYEVIISAEAKGLTGLSLLEGMTVITDVVIDQRSDVLYVPTAATLDVNGQESIVEVVDGVTVSSVTVATGIRNGRFVEITEGLKEGEVVRVDRSKVVVPISQ